jgi:hypothetical protein
LKFETRCRISSRSELFKLTGGIRSASIVGGVDGSTRPLFVSAAQSVKISPPVDHFTFSSAPTDSTSRQWQNRRELTVYKKSKVGFSESDGYFFRRRHSEANTLWHQPQILPQLAVALPKLISDFAALERRQRWCRKLSPRRRLFFFQRMYRANQNIGIVYAVGFW